MDLPPVMMDRGRNMMERKDRQYSFLLICSACQLSRPAWTAVTRLLMNPTFSFSRLSRPINSSSELMSSFPNQSFTEHFSFTLGNTCSPCAITYKHQPFFSLYVLFLHA
ncbi:hypothetical protein Hanom_Chr12g01149091 [Helianthus anomalus]